MSATRPGWSSLGFSKTYVLPGFLIFLVPVVALCFFLHAERSFDAMAREVAVTADPLGPELIDRKARKGAGVFHVRSVFPVDDEQPVRGKVRSVGPNQLRDVSLDDPIVRLVDSGERGRIGPGGSVRAALVAIAAIAISVVVDRLAGLADLRRPPDGRAGHPARRLVVLGHGTLGESLLPQADLHRRGIRGHRHHRCRGGDFQEDRRDARRRGNSPEPRGHRAVLRRVEGDLPESPDGSSRPGHRRHRRQFLRDRSSGAGERHDARRQDAVRQSSRC